MTPPMTLRVFPLRGTHPVPRETLVTDAWNGLLRGPLGGLLRGHIGAGSSHAVRIRRCGLVSYQVAS